MNIQDFISINNVGFKNPKDYFIDLANYNFYVYGNQKRLLIKIPIESIGGKIKYINIVYAVDLVHPILKIYASLSDNGIEFALNNSITCYPISYSDDINIEINKLIFNWDEVLGLTQACNSIGSLSKNRFAFFIGIGCIESSNNVITNMYHRSKLSAILFTKIAKEFKNCDSINFSSLVRQGFNEIEKNEIISIYEKKIIYQKILDHFLSN